MLNKIVVFFVKLLSNLISGINIKGELPRIKKKALCVKIREKLQQVFLQKPRILRKRQVNILENRCLELCSLRALFRRKHSRRKCNRTVARRTLFDEVSHLDKLWASPFSEAVGGCCLSITHNA